MSVANVGHRIATGGTMETIAWVAVIGIAMVLWEHAHPARALHRVPGWALRAWSSTAFQACVAYAAAATLDHALASKAIWHLQGLGVALEALAGYVVLTFVYYWWHRARHEIPWLWRTLHQLHHSATRLEVISSFYKHPLEIVANGVLSSAILYLLLGLDPIAATVASTLTGLAELFYHWNVRTPHWLGYWIQRPESHRVHHRRGHHTENYSDLPLWDFLFGTLDNPRDDRGECGFGVERELRVVSLLRGEPIAVAGERR